MTIPLRNWNRAERLGLIAVSLLFSQFSFARSITIFDVPGAVSTIVADMNDVGQVAGYYSPGKGPQDVLGFLRASDGNLQTFSASSNALYTQPFAINNSGVITGTYWVTEYSQIGFVRSSTGEIAEFAPPGTVHTMPFAISDGGVITGTYYDATNAYHGFVRDASGNVVSFDAPGADNFTWASAINASGEIVGEYQDRSGSIHGFLRDATGNFTAFDEPDATGGETVATAINTSGEVTGYYVDALNTTHGYIRDAAGNFTSFDVPGQNLATNPTSINDAGQITGLGTGSFYDVGFYRDPSGRLATFSVTGSTYTLPVKINSEGIIAGTCGPPSGAYHGFLMN
jgi:hypothetical protein